jgi:hypothetical protein
MPRHVCLVNKRFRVCDLNQPFLLAASLQDWLPEDHLARFVADVMNELDLSAIYAEYERSDGRGLSAYHPDGFYKRECQENVFSPETEGRVDSRHSGRVARASCFFFSIPDDTRGCPILPPKRALRF